MPARLIEATRNRNRHRLFDDRPEAGKALAQMLREDYKGSKALVLAIPSGGVPVGLALAQELDLDFDMVVVRKLQIPGNTEAGFGAMALSGDSFLNQDLLRVLHLSDEELESERRTVQRELERRNLRFREGRPFPDVEGRSVILVDDGLASGYTMLAAAHGVRSRGAREVAVAVPTAPWRSVQVLSDLVDRVYVANLQESGPFAVAAAYRTWRDLDQDEVVASLRAAGYLGPDGDSDPSGPSA